MTNDLIGAISLVVGLVVLVWLWVGSKAGSITPTESQIVLVVAMALIIGGAVMVAVRPIK